jgi:hypothetical protein
MRILKVVLGVLALSALPLHAADTPNSALNQIVDRIVTTEQAEMNSLKPFTPLVETYIQNLRDTAISDRSRQAIDISLAARCSPKASIWSL